MATKGTDVSRTPGEALFESYLSLHQVAFEYEKRYEGKLKVPDYSVNWLEQPYLFEVKDFNAPFLPRGGGPFQFHPYPPIRERITRARKKFGEYKEFCCAVVLYNNGAFVMLDKPDFMLGSMYGDSGFTFPFNPQSGVGDASQMEHAFLNRGMMISRHGLPRNTTISALITLTTIQPDYERLLHFSRASVGKSVLTLDKELAAADPHYDPERRIPRVIVWHNAVARIPFPCDLFCGPYDTHYGVVQKPDGVFQQITFRGALLPSRFEV